jgi:hypothetical protein
MGQFSLYTGPRISGIFYPYRSPLRSIFNPLAPADLSQLCFLHHVPFKIMPIAPNMVIYTYCMYVIGAIDVRTSVPEGIVRQFCSILWGSRLASSIRLITWGFGLFYPVQGLLSDDAYKKYHGDCHADGDCHTITGNFH